MLQNKKPFDFDKHFNHFKNSFFFDKKTYADLLIDINQSINDLPNKGPIGQKIQSPYDSFVIQCACLFSNKISVLISPLETAQSIETLRSQFHFNDVLESRTQKTNQSKTLLDFHSLNIDFQKLSFVVFTSGSTSAPKAVGLSFNNILYSAKGFIEYFQYKPSEKTLMNLPHHHVGGLMSLWRAFFSGGHLISQPHEKFDCISLVPLQLKRFLDDKNKRETLIKARIVLIGGAPVSEELRKQADDYSIKIYETYGMSESTSMVSINGEVLPYAKVTLDEDSHFVISGATLSLGYYQNNQFFPHKNHELKTNDRGVIDPKGRFHFVERTDLIFISGGENINPLIVEEKIRTHPDILDAYLVAIPDEKWGQMGILLYESNSGDDLDESQLRSFLKKNLHPHLIPKFFIKTKINSENSLKPKRSELNKRGHELFLKHIFSHQINLSPTKPLIVTFHGFLGDKGDFNFLELAFNNQYSFLKIDLPGHGKTKIHYFYSLKDFYKKLSDFILLFDPQPIFYGYSMGGRIALNLALDFITPKYLFLESASPGLEKSSEKEARYKNDLKLFDTYNSTHEFLTDWYEQKMFAPYKKTARFKSDIKSKENHSINDWKESLTIFSQGVFPLKSDILKKLQTKAFPILYICGNEDLKYNDLSSFYECSHTILDAGHNPHKTHPAEIIKKLKEIL